MKERNGKVRTLKIIGQKLLIMSLIFTSMFIMTACDELPEDLQMAISEAFSARASLNENVASQLLASGIISQNTHDLLIKSIQQNLTDFGNSVKKADSNTGKNLLKATVGWRVIPEDIDTITKDGEVIHQKWISPGGDNWAVGFITNALIYGNKSLAISNVPILGGNNKKIKPIEVISESLIEQLNKELSIPIYVLKPDLNNNIGIDGVMEAVSKASTSKNESGLTQYFAPATYLNDKNEEKPVTFLDPTDIDQQLVRMTINDKSTRNHSGTTIDYTYDSSRYHDGQVEITGTCGVMPTGDPFTGPFNSTLNAFMGFPALSQEENRLGRDMTVFNGGQAVLSVRIVEFNQDAVDYLYKNIGAGNSRFLVINNRAYLMEYPVGYISGFKESEDRKEYKSIIEESQLGFNLLTGKFSKFEKNSDGTLSATSHEIDNNDPYITYNGALNNLDETKASLVLHGNTGLTTDDTTDRPEDFLECNPPWDYALGEYTLEGSTTKKPRLVNMGRIVLRDYLEATYAPGVVANEQLIVLGRKLRVLQLEGNKNSILAEMYDKDGNVIEYAGQPIRLYINDFADLPAIKGTTPKVKYISASQESIGDGTAGGSDTDDTDDNTTDDTSDTTTDDTDDTDNDSGSSDISAALNSSITKIDRLSTEIVDKVSVSTLFPGSDIGTVDKNFTDDKPLFYAMLVKKNIFETGLFSGWINNTDAGKNSLAWWNQWLQDHGFQYKINSDTLTEYLSGNYAFELTKEGVIILDLQTISKIQEEFDADTKTHTAEWLHTVFMVLGFILVGYSLMLMIAWNVDVNVDLGFNILEKLSFGRWIAVKSYDEMPYINTDEINYIKFGDLLVSCIVLITVGIILITVNVVDLILMIIQLFGGIAKYITKLITGR